MASLVTSEEQNFEFINKEFVDYVNSLDISNINVVNIVEILTICKEYIKKYENKYDNFELKDEVNYHIKNIQIFLQNFLKICKLIDIYINIKIWPDFNKEADLNTFQKIFPHIEVRRAMQGCMHSAMTQVIRSEINKINEFKYSISNFVLNSVKNSTRDLSLFNLDYNPRSIYDVYGFELKIMIEFIFNNVNLSVMGFIEILNNYQEDLKQLESPIEKSSDNMQHW